ncbi:sarcosine oxidase [Actinomadura sp. CNU-125]|uniref:NAD(P)/FAD-dependent oxidoreductase n=1 Tax=Actinomadura sp. CNU-125 TaxID=1904961 RepID=UPI0009671C87|nr:FAD-binding oxidoreductase [Actinomadura sp. CNU-125]OLT23261.1 sarcosine oxidase [Actinomadura sp. CNU-125]
MQGQYDVIVVGAGPIGSATARHLADRGRSVLVVGPDEPSGFEDHRGVWAGYYDEGRLAHVLEVPLVTSLLAMRSIRRFAELRERTGVTFTVPTHSVSVMPEAPAGGSSADWFDRGILVANARDLGVEVSELDAAELREAYPSVTFEPGHVAVVQRDAAILNPRRLVRAELAAATSAAGADLVRDEVVRTERAHDGVRVTARSGASWTAGRVVLATGAASNATGLLPRPLLMPTFGATVVLVAVDGPDALDMPAMMYLKQRDARTVFGGIVMSPLRYPDGEWYVKVSGRSLLDTPLDTAEEIGAWVRTGGRQEDIGEALAVLRDLMPGREFGPARTRPCLVSATPTERPYIDLVDERTVIAVEGERGAMAADEIGRLTAELAVHGRWKDSIPHEVFRAQWGEPGWNTAGWLASRR